MYLIKVVKSDKYVWYADGLATIEFIKHLVRWLVIEYFFLFTG